MDHTVLPAITLVTGGEIGIVHNILACIYAYLSVCNLLRLLIGEQSQTEETW